MVRGTQSPSGNVTTQKCSRALTRKVDRSICLFLQEQAKMEAWVHGADMSLGGLRGKARASESKLKERMLIKRAEQSSDGPTQTTRTSLFNRPIELKVENGERMLRVEPDPRHAQVALHELGFAKKNAKLLSNPGAVAVQFACQDEL